MLYKLLRLPARVMLHFYCRSLTINRKEALYEKGPLILAANHPNSFLDAILLASVMRQPIYSLARGDAFVSPFVTRILHSINVLPVYRITEGVENLGSNYNTFDKVQQLLADGKTVLIFSEGRCINEWHLRPLKKGTARLATEAWSKHTDLKVLPVGINYSSFRHFGKKIIINFGNIITAKNLDDYQSGKALLNFNEILKSELSNLVYEIPADDRAMREKLFHVRSSPLQKILLAIPAVAGYLLHAPFYFSAHLIIRNRANDHYDSVMAGIMLLFYPLYVLLLTALLWWLTGSMLSLLALAIMPLTALCLLHSRDVY